MLPSTYAIPTNVLLVLAGALACFAGYRQFKLVLTVAGFFIGALAASSMMAPSNTVGMLAAALAGGVVGAIVLFFAYFVGIALTGAGLGAAAAHVGWEYFASGDPPAAVLIVLAVVGAIGAMVLQRYVIVVATAFGGAWTLIVGALALMAPKTAEKVPSGEVWIPTSPTQRWAPIAWIVLGLIGTAVQLGVTGRKKKQA